MSKRSKEKDNFDSLGIKINKLNDRKIGKWKIECNIELSVIKNGITN